MALGSCGQGTTDQQAALHGQNEEQSVSPADGNRIACAPEGAADFSPVCTLERTGDTVIVRNPDGGFHRLLIGAGGNATAADGAEAAQVAARAHGEIEIEIGVDRYRLPAAP